MSWLSVAWATLSGAASLSVGVLDHSLAVVGVGLNLLGDLTGSVVLIWRFSQERRVLHRAESAERVARLAVGTSLVVVAAFLAVQSIRRLADGTGAATAVAPILVAAASVIVLPPLARAKRHAGTLLGSRALRGDGTLSGVGAAIALLALVGLVVSRALGWWWADSTAALIVAVIAAVEARAVFAPATMATGIVRSAEGRPVTQPESRDAHPEDLPWNDVPADSDVPPGSTEPDPAEVVGDEGEEVDAAAHRVPDPYAKYHQETLDQRLAEEEPDRGARGEPDPEAGGLEAAEPGGDDVDLGEADETDPVEAEDTAAEEAAIHIRPDDRV